MENKFLLEAILKPFNLPESKRKELATKLDLPLNTQKDLMFMAAILVSTGTNKNGATFLGSELIKARNTISQKALDVEHVEDKIIGHIASSIFMDFDGNIIDDEELHEELSKVTTTDEPKKIVTKIDSLNMDVGIVCAVYKDRFPQIAEEIEKGTWKVSMECYYKDYDLKIGKIVLPKIIASTLIGIDEKIKADIETVNAGTVLGTSDVSRVLRDISFCGVGIVKNPANERSIILEAAGADNKQEDSLIKLAASENENEKTAIQLPSKGWFLTQDGKSILNSFNEDAYDKALEEAAKLSIESNKDVFVLNAASILKSSDSNINPLSKVIHYKVDKDNNIIKVIPYENKQEVVSMNPEVKNENTEFSKMTDEMKKMMEDVEYAALLDKEGIKVPDNVEEVDLQLPKKQPLDVSKFDIPLHEIIDILWLQVYDRPVLTNEGLKNTQVVEYNDPVDNRRHYREQSFVLPRKNLFLLDSKQSVESAIKLYSYAVTRMTTEDKEESFYNIMYSAIIHSVDTQKFEETMLENNLNIENIKEYSTRFAVPRLEMMPLESREQIIAAMSRCMHVKENLTDKEKEYMVVNILKAAKKFNIDVTNFKERIKKLNY